MPFRKSSTLTPVEPLGRDVKRTTVVVVIGMIMAILDTTIVSVALDSLARDFHTNIATIQWVTTGYLLALAIVIPISGWGVHRIGAKPLYIGALVIFVAGSALCGMAWSATTLIIFRVLQGFGGGMIMPVGQTLMAQSAGPKKMNRVMAVAGIPTMLGPILGPVIGGFIVTNFSWRWIFYVNVPVGILAIALAIKLLQPSHKDSDHKFDLLGFALLSPGLAFMVYGLSSVNNPGGFMNHTVLYCISIGVVLTALFVLRSFKAPEPLIDMSLFRNRYFSIATICSFIVGASLYGTAFLLPLYYQVARGQSALIAGLMMAPQGIGAALIMRKGALMADKYGARKVVPFGMALLAIGTFAYTQVTVNTSFLLLGVSLFVRGTGLGLAMMPVFAAAFQGLKHDQVPRASTASNIIRQVGGSIGVAILAVVLQGQFHRVLPGFHEGAAAGTVPYWAAVKLADAFGNTFWWSVGLCALGIIPALFLPTMRSAPVPTDEGPIAIVD